jgi:CRP-like cAMP-binding protein
VETGFIHVLLEGWAFSAKTTHDGLRAILGLHMSGDLLDITGHNSDGACDVQGITSIKVATIPSDALMAAVSGSSNLARAFWMLSARNASVLSEWVLNLGRRGARSRLAHLLCEISARQKAEGVDVQSGYVMPLTQEQLADSLGLTAVHLNRVLQTLRRDKLVECANSYVRILDWAKLAAEGDFNAEYLRLPFQRPLRVAA